MSKSLMSNILTYGKSLASSRLLGLLRDISIGLSLGVNSASDIILIALTIPDFISNISFGAGAQLALLPYFQRAQSKDHSFKQLKETCKKIILFTVPLILLLCYFKTKIIHFFLPAYSSESLSSFLPNTHIYTLLVISALMLLAVPLRSYLQAHKSFKNLGLENVIFNICVLIGIFLHYVTSVKGILFVFIALSFIMRILWLFLSVRKLNAQENIESSEHVSSKFPYSQIFYSSVITTLMIAAPAIIRAISTYLGEGWATKFIFANRLVDMAMLLFTTIIGSVVYSELTETLKQHKDRLMQSASLIFFVLLPSLGLAGFLFTFALLNQVNPASEIYNYLYILLALSVFIPVRLFIHYYNLILIANRESLVSAITSIFAALASYFLYKEYFTPSTDPYSLINIQAILIYPVGIGLMLHFIKSSGTKIYWIFAVFSYCFFHFCYHFPNFYWEQMTAGVTLVSLTTFYMWKKRRLFLIK